MVQLSFPLRMRIPDVLLVGRKKSKMLLLLMTFPLFRSPALDVLPSAKMALDGRLAPAGPMLHKETVLPSLPVVVPVLKMTVPPTLANAVVEDPRIVQPVTVLFVASAINRIVPVPAIAETVVLEMVREFPPVFKPFI